MGPHPVTAGSNKLQWENVMTLLHKGSKKVTMRRFARAAVVAALLCTPGAAEKSDVTMPANCQQYLQQCSLKIWPQNSFPKTGVTQSVTFSNGAVLTCTSTGPNKPRKCEFEPPPDEALREQCADLKRQLRNLMNDQDTPQTMVGKEREYLRQAMEMTPDQLRHQIDLLQDLVDRPPPTRLPDLSTQLNSVTARNYETHRSELNFMKSLLKIQALGPELGGATPAQMQARANQMVKDQQAWADEQQRSNSQEINSLNNQIAEANCLNVGEPLPGKSSGAQ